MDLLRRHSPKFTIVSATFNPLDSLNVANTEPRTAASYVFIEQGSLEIVFPNGDSNASYFLDANTLSNIENLMGKHLFLSAGADGAKWMVFCPANLNEKYDATLVNVTDSASFSAEDKTKFLIPIDGPMNYKDNIIDEMAYLKILPGKTVDITTNSPQRVLLFTLLNEEN